MSITVRKIKGGFAVFKNGKQHTKAYPKREAQYAAKFLRESKYK